MLGGWALLGIGDRRMQPRGNGGFKVVTNSTRVGRRTVDDYLFCPLVGWLSVCCLTHKSSLFRASRLPERSTTASPRLHPPAEVPFESQQSMCTRILVFQML
jgi:hypothetical protein